MPKMLKKIHIVAHIFVCIYADTTTRTHHLYFLVFPYECKRGYWFSYHCESVSQVTSFNGFHINLICTYGLRRCRLLTNIHDLFINGLPYTINTCIYRTSAENFRLSFFLCYTYTCMRYVMKSVYWKDPTGPTGTTIEIISHFGRVMKNILYSLSCRINCMYIFAYFCYIH